MGNAEKDEIIKTMLAQEKSWAEIADATGYTRAIFFIFIYKNAVKCYYLSDNDAESIRANIGDKRCHTAFFIIQGWRKWGNIKNE